jgi:hypothetical protein
MVLTRLSESHLNEKAAVNYDAKAGLAIFIARLTLFIGVLLPLVRFIKLFIRRAPYSVALLKERRFIKHITVMLVLIGCCVYLLTGLKLVVDARMIPGSLAHMDAIFEKMQEWFLLVNNGQTSGGLFDPLLRVYAVFAILSAAAACFLMRRRAKCSGLKS